MRGHKQSLYKNIYNRWKVTSQESMMYEKLFKYIYVNFMV